MGQNSNHHGLSLGWKYAPEQFYNIPPHSFSLTVFFFYLFYPFSLSLSISYLYLSISLSENALNKAVARSHQTLASVEDQDPHGEHINSKSVWHAFTSSPLPFIHAPHLHIYQKGPSGFLLYQQTPPRGLISTRRFDGGKARGLATCAGWEHACTWRWCTNTHKCTKSIFSSFFFVCLHKLCTNVQRQSKQKSERELVSSGWCERWPCSSNSSPHLSSPTPPLPSPSSHHQVPGDERARDNPQPLTNQSAAS